MNHSTTILLLKTFLNFSQLLSIQYLNILIESAMREQKDAHHRILSKKAKSFENSNAACAMLANAEGTT